MIVLYHSRVLKRSNLPNRLLEIAMVEIFDHRFEHIFAFSEKKKKPNYQFFSIRFLSLLHGTVPYPDPCLIIR